MGAMLPASLCLLPRPPQVSPHTTSCCTRLRRAPSLCRVRICLPSVSQEIGELQHPSPAAVGRGLNRSPLTPPPYPQDHPFSMSLPPPTHCPTLSPRAASIHPSVSPPPVARPPLPRPRSEAGGRGVVRRVRAVRRLPSSRGTRLPRGGGQGAERAAGNSSGSACTRAAAKVTFTATSK